MKTEILIAGEHKRPLIRALEATAEALNPADARALRLDPDTGTRIDDGGTPPQLVHMQMLSLGVVNALLHLLINRRGSACGIEWSQASAWVDGGPIGGTLSVDGWSKPLLFNALGLAWQHAVVLPVNSDAQEAKRIRMALRALMEQF